VRKHRQPESGIDLSRIAPPPAEGMDLHQVGKFGERPQGKILFTHPKGKTPAPHRGGELGAHDRPGRPLSGGKIMNPRMWIARAAGLFRKDHLEEEMASDIQELLEMAIEENLR